ncbi:uncharacterized protein K460DRAFT_364380 [Cucurbitaria berberidis CBS 394.84]|uniref:Uncharacterized protein n=1 Tax=Cucurbitaria berberidis CBS 394.84 TaxID=1168544 RepID=A0A9P4GMY8_9PLEO|nr:uncharacterized protein K460DRAFT_364380 [Cucurbitaria berberidis CBS 394.84]KAF1848399.1 hypothetical protein K460DRAFT_364380 [Cucurbitaria berberidis CBS 394.84]
MSGPIKSSLVKAIAAIKEPAFQKATEKFVEDIAAKIPIITGIKLNGSRPHKSHDDPADPKPVISFALYKSNKLNSRNRVGSGHVHDDGTGHVNFSSKYKQYRAITGMEYKPPIGQSSSSGESKSGGSGLTWRTNEQAKYAEWWDGTNWVAGNWSNEYQKWCACYNGQWYYW